MSDRGELVTAGQIARSKLHSRRICTECRAAANPIDCAPRFLRTPTTRELFIIWDQG
jgi:hypothetical protein